MKRILSGVSIVLLLTLASNLTASARITLNVDYNDLDQNKIINLQPRTRYNLTFINLPTTINFTKLTKDFNGKIIVPKKTKAKTNNQTVHKIITLRSKKGFEGPVSLELFSGTNNGKDLGTLLETIELTFKINNTTLSL